MAREAAVPRQGYGARKREHLTGGAWRLAKERRRGRTPSGFAQLGLRPKGDLGRFSSWRPFLIFSIFFLFSFSGFLICFKSFANCFNSNKILKYSIVHCSVLKQ
jgi:hypothetical protein